MDITWGPDKDQPGGQCLVTEPIGAGYDRTRPDEHFVLRVRPNGERVAWMVDFHTSHMPGPYESVASGLSLDTICAQRRAIRAMLDLIDAGAPPEATDYMSDDVIAEAMAAYAAAVATNGTERAVAGLDGDTVIDAEIVDEVLECAAHAGIFKGDLSAGSYRCLTAAVAAYRQELAARCTSADEAGCENAGHDH